MGMSFFALTRLPLPEAITLNYAQPLFVVVFSALFLGETIRIHRWSAVVVGLIGVLIVSWPKLSLLTGGATIGTGELAGVVAALAGGRHCGGGAAAGQKPGAHGIERGHRHLVLADSQRGGPVDTAVRLAGAGCMADRLSGLRGHLRRHRARYS